MGGSFQKVPRPRNVKDIGPDPCIGKAEQFIDFPSHSTGDIGMMRAADPERRYRSSRDLRYHDTPVQYSRYIGGKPHAGYVQGKG